MDFILQILDKELCWYRISHGKLVTAENIKKYPYLPWDWDDLSQNQIVTMEIVGANMHLPWDYETLSFDVNLTAKFVIENKDKPWCFETISENKLNYRYENVKKNICIDLRL
jgi:hypothetical protein